MSFRLFVAFFAFMSCPVFAVIPESPMDVPVEDVLNSPELKEIGFPFENLRPSKIISMGPGMNLVDKCPEFDIGRCIVFLYQSGRMKDDRRADTLDEILQKCMSQESPQFLSLNPSNSDLWANREMLTAALVLVADTGDIRSIAPLLEFHDLNFERDFETRYHLSFVSGGIRFGPSEETDEKGINRWPAQNAIISHATATVQLLREAAADGILSQDLRLRAVSYLLYLDENIHRTDWFLNCDREFLEKCLAVRKPYFHWKHTEKDEEKRVTEFRERSHRELVFKKKIRGYLDRILEEENKGSAE